MYVNEAIIKAYSVQGMNRQYIYRTSIPDVYLRLDEDGATTAHTSRGFGLQLGEHLRREDLLSCDWDVWTMH